MKSLKSRLRRQDAPGPASPAAPAVAASAHAGDWNKYDDRLMKAAERGDVEKVSSILSKKGVNPGKLDVEGRSAFHVVASKGNLECLNAILIHGIDITTSDTAGRNALHLAAKYGHALCLQKLLQYNCPTEHMDLQGRTALHDAAMADCPSSIQLLCDHGASVNAKDIDGRTPLVLATQMCRPTICQLLIDRGADINSRDKQNRTALMLGCEYGCRDAVEILIKNGADVGLLDALGHDSSYYARIGDNLDILALLKTASENTNKGREFWKKGPSLQQRNLMHMQDEGSMKSNQREHQNIQDLETENEDLKERLRKIQQEQRILLDKVNGLQLQLNEEVMVADDLESEREKLKSLLAAKEKQHEESLRTIEALKNRFKYYESDHLGSGSHFSNRKEDMLLKQGQMYITESQCPSGGMPAHLQSRSMLRPLELSLSSQTSHSENEILRKELEAMRTFCDSAKQDRLKLQNELAHKVAECKALALECERVKEDSDEQIKQLEDALKDVQKRMYESEGKVKQMQTHFLALKEHLTSEAATGTHRAMEELKDQLKEMKAKYEGASAEVHNLTTEMKNHYVPLKVSEEMKKSRDVNIDDLNKKLSDVTQKYTEKKLEVEKLLMENDKLIKNVSRLETVFIPPEKHEKELVTLRSSISELKKQLSELNKRCSEDQEKIHTLVSENTSLKKTLGSQYVPAKTHEEIKTALNNTLEKTSRELSNMKKRCEDLNQELMKIKDENQVLKRNLENTQNQMRAEFISLDEHEGTMRAVSRSLKEAQEAHAAVLADYSRGQEEITSLHAEIKAQKKELDTIHECIKLKYAPIISFEESEQKFKATEKELKEKLSEQTQKCSAREEEARRSKQEIGKLKEQVATLERELKDQGALVENARETERALSRKAEELSRQVKELTQKNAEVKKEKEKLVEEKAKQAAEILAAQNILQKQHVPVEQVEALKKSLNGTIENLKEELKNKQRCYEKEQQAVAKLQQLLENQKNCSVPLAEHLQTKEALEKEVGIMKASLREKEEESQSKCQEVSKLQTEVQDAKQALKKLETREVVDLSKYTATKSDLETQISNLNEKLASLNRKYDEVCEEVLHAKKKKLSAKDEKDLLHLSIEQEIKDQKERCDKSLTTITELQRRIQESAKQIEAKDNKITELLNDVERLKQALNGLSQLTYTSGSPPKRQSQLVDALQHQVKALQQQLADTDRQHQEVIAIYRTHLLSAAQGHMDEDVQAALLQIIQMRQGLVC
ncbi:uveal autoantigen with coiled-coil domains and ankyrin repeats isoform 3-T3 [Ctenodactylus gundi]